MGLEVSILDVKLLWSQLRYGLEDLSAQTEHSNKAWGHR